MLFSEYPPCHSDKYLKSYGEQEAHPFLKKPIHKLLLRFGYSFNLFYTYTDEAYGFIREG
jgi:hypothetical protein